MTSLDRPPSRSSMPHSRGFIRRDIIKPANIMVCPQGERFAVKVLDFGLAKATREATNDTSLTHHGAMMGTPDYVAPEQAANAPNADIRPDIYSLGCTLYHLLSGHPRPSRRRACTRRSRAMLRRRQNRSTCCKPTCRQHLLGSWQG